MPPTGPETIQAFLAANAGWAAGLAASMLALTALAGNLLNPARKDEIALWLMGAHSDETWSRSLVSLFDAVFGARHLSWRCFLRSTAASLAAVALIWLLMGNLGALGLRIRAELSLGSVLVLALAVNVIADYLSLLETRLVLGHIHRLDSTLAQAGVLVLDLALSAAIIWLAIFAYLRSPLHEGEIESFAEILGVFSVFSVLFYSTFLTSVWTWAYILSTWLVRLFTRLNLAHWLDVEHKPVRILGLALAAITFFGAFAAAAALQRDPDGLTVADRALCGVFKGRVCFDVAALTRAEQAKLEFFELGFDRNKAEPRVAAQFWTLTCRSGDTRGCINLGQLLEHGIGMDSDPVEAARLYRQGCEMGHEDACGRADRLAAD